MKKKISVLLATLVLTLAMGTSAMAANSPQSPTIYGYADVEIKPWMGFNNAESRALATVFGDYLAAQGRFEAYDGEWLSSEHKDLVLQMNNAALKIASQYAGVTGYERADVIGYWNLGAPKDVDMSKGIDVALMNVPAVKYDKYVVIHITSAGKVENIPVKVVGGKIVGTFTNLSPVIVIGLKDKFDVNDVVPATKGSTGVAAPKTGEQNMAVVYVVAAVCLMGALVYVNRKKVTL